MLFFFLFNLSTGYILSCFHPLTPEDQYTCNYQNFKAVQPSFYSSCPHDNKNYCFVECKDHNYLNCDNQYRKILPEIFYETCGFTEFNRTNGTNLNRPEYIVMFNNKNNFNSHEKDSFNIKYYEIDNGFIIGHQRNDTISIYESDVIEANTSNFYALYINFNQSNVIFKFAISFNTSNFRFEEYKSWYIREGKFFKFKIEIPPNVDIKNPLIEIFRITEEKGKENEAIYWVFLSLILSSVFLGSSLGYFLSISIHH